MDIKEPLYHFCMFACPFTDFYINPMSIIYTDNLPSIAKPGKVECKNRNLCKAWSNKSILIKNMKNKNSKPDIENGRTFYSEISISNRQLIEFKNNSKALREFIFNSLTDEFIKNMLVFDNTEVDE